MICKTFNGTRVYVTYIKDVEPNEGGFYCEICNEDYHPFDNFCVHTDDCDCGNLDEVEDYIKEYVSKIVNY